MRDVLNLNGFTWFTRFTFIFAAHVAVIKNYMERVVSHDNLERASSQMNLFDLATNCAVLEDILAIILLLFVRSM